MTLCYTRHETAPGTHADIPHEHERYDMSEPDSFTKEHYEYGRLWPDGTFDNLHATGESWARKSFQENAYELNSVPKSLRPVLSRRRVVTTTDTYPAEPVPEAAK